jgi:two-component SAPR family response regulator
MQPNRILVVEDEIVVAMNYASILRDAGYEVVGPLRSVDAALRALPVESVHAAMLDIDVAGEPIDPVVQVLAERKIPFVYVSGVAQSALSGKYAMAYIVEKPCTATQLLQALQTILQS